VFAANASETSILSGVMFVQLIVIPILFIRLPIRLFCLSTDQVSWSWSHKSSCSRVLNPLVSLSIMCPRLTFSFVLLPVLSSISFLILPPSSVCLPVSISPISYLTQDDHSYPDIQALVRCGGSQECAVCLGARLWVSRLWCPHCVWRLVLSRIRVRFRCECLVYVNYV
jgi:hypothetical protein